MILITGATGTVGTELVRLLTARGVPVRALVRDADRARGKLDSRAELRVGDLERPETIDPAIKGAEKVFLLTGPEEGARVLQENGIEAARRAGVRHLVKLSAVDSDPGVPCRFLHAHADMEANVKASGLPFTILRPHSYMQNTLAFRGTIASQGAFYTPAAGSYPMVDTRDVAAVAASVLTESGHEGKTYTITGPEPISHAEVAEKIGAAIGKPVRYVEVPETAAREAMLAMRLPAWIVEGLLELYRYYAAGNAKKVTSVIDQVGRKKPLSFDQFARDYSGAFTGPSVPA